MTNVMKNILILCLTIIFSVSISAADLYEPRAKPSQVSVEMEPMTCEDADMVMTRGLNNFEPIQLAGDELASACCKICTKGKACGNSCIQRVRPAIKEGAAHAMVKYLICDSSLSGQTHAVEQKPWKCVTEKSVGAKTTEGEIRSIALMIEQYRIRPFGTWTQDVTGDYFFKSCFGCRLREPLRRLLWEFPSSERYLKTLTNIHHGTLAS